MTRLGVMLCLEQLDPRNPARQTDILLLVDEICLAVPHMTSHREISDGGSCHEGSTKLLTSLLAMRALKMAEQVSCLSEERRLMISHQLALIARYEGFG